MLDFKEILSLIKWKHIKNLNLRGKDWQIQAKVTVFKKNKTTKTQQPNHNTD